MYPRRGGCFITEVNEYTPTFAAFAGSCNIHSRWLVQFLSNRVEVCLLKQVYIKFTLSENILFYMENK